MSVFISKGKANPGKIEEHKYIASLQSTWNEEIVYILFYSFSTRPQYLFGSSISF